MFTKESSLERSCGRIAKHRDCLWLKIERRKGWPDRLLIKRGVYIWVELKTASGRLSPLQIKIREMLSRKGLRYEVVRSVQEFKELL